MNIFHRQLAAFSIAFILSSPGLAQRHGDALNALEIDQLRETALEPELRLKLLLKFARARLATLEQVRSDPKTTDRTQQTHDRLQDFLDIYDELNDNLDMYVDRKDDIRKPLKAVIEADVEFQSKLRALKDAAATPKDDPGQYQFILDNALQTLDESAPDHRQLMTEQEEAAKRKKK